MFELLKRSPGELSLGLSRSSQTASLECPKRAPRHSSGELHISSLRRSLGEFPRTLPDFSNRLPGYPPTFELLKLESSCAEPSTFFEVVVIRFAVIRFLFWLAQDFGASTSTPRGLRRVLSSTWTPRGHRTFCEMEEPTGIY